jgi:hypothetical protein
MTSIEELAQPRVIAPLHSEAAAIEQSRAVAEVAAAVRVSQDNPRDVSKSVEQMRQACTQRALADRAFYSLPRAGGRVEGSTVHLARELARCWTNVDYGIRELRRDDKAGQSEMQAWAWDQEANVRSTRSFIVPHERMARKERQKLTDLGDIANNNNSVAARAVRETIFTILPVWFREEAEATAARTLQDGGGKTLAQQVADALAHYSDTYNVAQAQLEDRLSRPAKDWTAADLGNLRVLSGELARGEKRIADEFPSAEKPAATGKVTAADVTGEVTAEEAFPNEPKS